MSLLTPLYIVGLFAVSLPLVFHLIRRLPRGHFSFSSLMFLGPSPPRLTRKSCLDNLLLLLFRVLALILIALAFSRPFWRNSALSDVVEAEGRRVAILVDTSASMRRGNLWQQALSRVDQVLGELGPGDDVGLFAFDTQVRELVKFNDLAPADPKQQVARVGAALRGVAPTWAATDLGQALISAADELNRTGNAKDADAELIRQIVLISDLQQGSRIDALQAYQWPREVRPAVHRVAASEPTNAGLHLVADRSGESQQDGGAEELRVRVTNDRDSRAEQFELRWLGEDGIASDQRPIGVYVPPGESRVVRVARLPEHPAAGRLRLTGDDHPFDNTLHLVPLRQDEVSLLYIGAEEDRDADSMRYYLRMALPETARRKVNLIARKPEEVLSGEDLAAARLTVVTAAVADGRAAQLKRYMEDGGTVLYVLRDAAAGKTLGRIMGLNELVVEEARMDDYAMFGEIAFGHPLFAPFADPRFNDFTKIHFWKHRCVKVEDVSSVEVLARFDSGEPALFEQAHEKGRLLVLTSGWHPEDSQLARSTKFVPLMHGVLERAGVADVVLPQYEIGDRVVFAAADQRSEAAVVRKPDGSNVKLASHARVFTGADQPGVYQLHLADARNDFAVNVPAVESRTAPREVEQLEDLGVRVGNHATRLELAEKRRQIRDLELEGKQKLWRLLIVAALGVLIVETWLAGHLARRSGEQPEVTG